MTQNVKTFDCGFLGRDMEFYFGKAYEYFLDRNYCFHLYHISMIREGKCSSEMLLVVYQTISLARGSKLYYPKANISSFLPNTSTFIRLFAETIIIFNLLGVRLFKSFRLQRTVHDVTIYFLP